MVELETIRSPDVAFVAGLITSVHCVGMCGPLACGVAGLGKGRMRHGAAAAYHLGRLVSYTVLGAAAGAISERSIGSFAKKPGFSLLPWALVVVLLVTGLGLDKRLPRPAFLNRLGLRLRLWFTKLGAGRGGLALGLATPLLPCTPLYLMLGAALTSAEAGRGAELMASFALGSIPLLWVTQGGWLWLRGRLGHNGIEYARRGLAVAMALVLAWRLHGSGPGCCG